MAERPSGMEGLSESEYLDAVMRRDVLIYVDTSIDTRFVFQTERTKTVRELQEILKHYHHLLYPEIGKVVIREVMLERNSHLYPMVLGEPIGGFLPNPHGFIKVNVVRQADGQISLPAEPPDAERLNSQPVSDKVNAVEIVTDTREDSIFTNLIEEDGIAKPEEKCLVVTTQERVSGTSESGGNASRKMVEVAAAGKDSISNTLNALGAVNSSGNICSKLSAEISQGMTAFSDKMLFEADFLTQSFLQSGDDSLGFQIEENSDSDNIEAFVSQETGGNATIRSLDFSSPEVFQNAFVNSSMQCKLVNSKKNGCNNHKIRFPKTRQKADCVEDLTEKMVKHSRKLSAADLECRLLNDRLTSGSEGTSKKRWKSKELESAKICLGNALSIDTFMHPEGIFASLVKSSKAHEMDSKSEEPTEDTSHAETRGIQELENSTGGNVVGVINSKQFQVYTGDISICSDLDGKVSILNKSRDVEMSNLIASLLSFTSANPMPSEDLLEFRDVYMNRSIEQSSKHKKKKRKLMPRKTKKQRWTSADQLEHVVDVSNGKCPKFLSLQKADDKGKSQKAKSNKFSLIEMQDSKITEAECLQNIGNTSTLNDNESENLNDGKVTSQIRFSSENMLCKHVTDNICSLHKIGTRSTHVFKKAEADSISKDVLPSLRGKGNKSKVVQAKHQEKRVTDNLSETESKFHNGIVVKCVALESAKNNMCGSVTDSTEMKTCSPGKTRLSRKIYLEKLSQDAVNRVIQEDITEGNDRSSKSSNYTGSHSSMFIFC
ncbi:hypothetical protein O6H91_06G140400 [Diphasiastrum complanatum]|uniref:Uncharacterized protein n=1 Tax=Diphasiastrum complanatum TaxID=34168 RepID=A0ACC2DJY4_DIPCM|nr:hypothetical protein O6H91_06G140400 [Diphasiastrum complanatum]